MWVTCCTQNTKTAPDGEPAIELQDIKSTLEEEPSAPPEPAPRPLPSGYVVVQK